MDVIGSLKKFSDLEVDETANRIKRKYPYLEDTEELRADRDPRTVYVVSLWKSWHVICIWLCENLFVICDVLISNVQ